MNYEEAVAYLDAHVGHGMSPGLARIRALLAMMGNPQTGYPIIHLAGTNGKTSTARMATMLCVAHGLTTGTFISPHLQRIEERIAVNGHTATSEQFAQAVADVAAFADIFESRTSSHLTYFELTAAMAFAWFAEQAVDVGVVEVGLGGRLDATNAARAEVAVLTEIGLEHTEILGDRLELIAGEKLGILEPGGTLVAGPLTSELWPLVEAKVSELGATLYRYGRDFAVEEAVRAVGGWQVEISGIHDTYPDILLPVHGRHQTLNLAVAVAACEALFGRSLDPGAVQDGISVVTVPGRMEAVETDPIVMLDGAHNPDGFAVLGHALAEEFPTTEWVLMLGCMADKDLEQMLPRLSGRLRHVLTTSVDSERAAEPGELAERASRLVEAPVEAIPSNRDALERARDLASGPGGGVLVAGSLYLVGAVRSLIQGDERPQRNER